MRWLSEFFLAVRIVAFCLPRLLAGESKRHVTVLAAVRFMPWTVNGAAHDYASCFGVYPPRKE